ncbi:MAG: arylsulfatase [Phycisphaerales bacterium]|jgi:arylsulfatase A|nr:arylsulfatase [Phycisphaerales bacterium]MBT7171719.1 arylsulfatase [Phycisphaerales bacterium]
MKRRQFLKATGATVAGAAITGAALLAEDNPAPAALPNIVLINADDLGYGDLSCYGATKVKTPNIDKLATQGRRFTDAHSASAVCTPSRYSLLTGDYPIRKRGGIWKPIFLKNPLIIPPKKTTIASLLKQKGYATAIIGKWHLGFGTKNPIDWNASLKPGPLELGFDYYYGVPVVNSHPPFVYVENHHVVGLDKADPFVYRKRAATQSFHEKMGLGEIGGAKKAHLLYRDEKVGMTLTEKATTWLKAQKKDKPFFLYFATTNIHHPFTPAKRFQGTSQCGRYGDFIHELDWIVGEVVKTLDDMGVADNTLVIFTSDNGGMLNAGGQEAWKKGHRLNGDLLGFKFDAWEGGHRIPFIARWPGKIKPRSTSGELISNVDMLATFAAATGQTLKETEGIDSFNVLPALVGEPKTPIRDSLLICPFKPTHLALRKGKWMYISAQGNGGFNGKPGQHTCAGAPAFRLTKAKNSDIITDEGKFREDAPPVQLYNLEEDVNEAQNLCRKHPEIVKEMQAQLKAIRAAKRSAPKR